MEILLQRIEKLKSILLDINKIIFQILSDKRLQDWILLMIKKDQLFDKGVSEENIVLGYYSPVTESINPNKKAGTHFTLLDTGAFFDSFVLNLNAHDFIINADGEKEDRNLFEVFNDKGNILGLTEDNLQKLIENLKPKIVNQIWDQL